MRRNSNLKPRPDSPRVQVDRTSPVRSPTEYQGKHLCFLGAAPPAGSGKHNCHIAVHTVDVASLGLGTDATPAFLGFNLSGHTLARAEITPWWEAT